MKSNLIVIASLLALLTTLACTRSKPSILGMPCYHTVKKAKITQVTEEDLKNYRILKDTVFQIPHAPIHRCIRAPQQITYVGLYTDDTISSVKKRLKENPYVRKQRSDSLGFHCLLSKDEKQAYLFLTPGKANPVIFLSKAQQPQRLKKAFNDKSYYASRLDCNER